MTRPKLGFELGPGEEMGQIGETRSIGEGRKFACFRLSVAQYTFWSSDFPWLESQLIEAVMTVRNLINGRTWTSADVDRALSSYALTTVMMTRFHIVEKVKRSLNTDLARVPKVA